MNIVQGYKPWVLRSLFRKTLRVGQPYYFATATATATAATQSQQTSQDDLFDGILSGNRRSLSKALTLVESTNSTHRLQAASLLTQLLSHAAEKASTRRNPSYTTQPVVSTVLPHHRNPTFRIGVSGPPGAGKSTLIDALGMHLVSIGKKVAVMAVDPSSMVTGGSILGDKTRMESLSRELNAFVRPSPSKGFLGGVTANSYESILLCEAAGYDIILIETVGVGQSEISVSELTDAFLLLIPPANGDELQGIKRGIMEVADVICVTKADGDTEKSARRTQVQYQKALTITESHDCVWHKKVLTCTIQQPKTIQELWETLEEYRTTTLAKGNAFHVKRQEQRQKQLWSHLYAELTHRIRTSSTLYHKDDINMARMEQEVIEGLLLPRQACYCILDKLFSSSTFQPPSS